LYKFFNKIDLKQLVRLQQRRKPNSSRISLPDRQQAVFFSQGSKAFAPPSALPGIFVSPLRQASLPRYQIKMPLQLR
jgi:hypothetical protein